MVLETEEANLTASTVLSFAQKLEANSEKFYVSLAEKFAGKDSETFMAFARESKKNQLLITRTYQETISDALEACFSFKGFRQGDYRFETVLTKNMNRHDALRIALKLESEASKFYLDLAEQSKSLLATIPSAFNQVAAGRKKREHILESILERELQSNQK